jgi:hypothetical protein
VPRASEGLASQPNTNLDPFAIARGSERKVWWRCGSCGHEWQTAVNDRTRPRPTGCPKCSLEKRAAGLTVVPAERSFATRYPHLLEEWHPTRNGDLDPHTVAASSVRKLWWRVSRTPSAFTAVGPYRSKLQPSQPPDEAASALLLQVLEQTKQEPLLRGGVGDEAAVSVAASPGEVLTVSRGDGRGRRVVASQRKRERGLTMPPRRTAI